MRNIRKAKSFLESMGYKVIKESGYDYSGFDVSDDLQDYLVEYGIDCGDGESGPLVNSFSMIIPAMDKDDAERQAVEILKDDDGFCGCTARLATEEEVEKYYQDAYDNVYDDDDEFVNPAAWGVNAPVEESLNEGKLIQPKYHDGDVVYIGDAGGYQGTFLIRGDITNFPSELDAYIRRICKYGNTEDQLYKIEYNLQSDHQFEKDYKEFFSKIEPILNKNNLEIIDID